MVNGLAKAVATFDFGAIPGPVYTPIGSHGTRCASAAAAAHRPGGRRECGLHRRGDRSGARLPAGRRPGLGSGDRDAGDSLAQRGQHHGSGAAASAGRHRHPQLFRHGWASQYAAGELRVRQRLRPLRTRLAGLLSAGNNTGQVMPNQRYAASNRVLTIGASTLAVRLTPLPVTTREVHAAYSSFRAGNAGLRPERQPQRQSLCRARPARQLRAPSPPPSAPPEPLIPLLPDGNMTARRGAPPRRPPPCSKGSRGRR